MSARKARFRPCGSHSGMPGDVACGEWGYLCTNCKRLKRMTRARKWNTTSPAKLAEFVQNNPGLTAAMIAVLWRRPYGTISAVLHGMTARNEITRRMERGMRGGKVQAWRYYSNVLGAVDEVFSSTQV